MLAFNGIQRQMSWNKNHAKIDNRATPGMFCRMKFMNLIVETATVSEELWQQRCLPRSLMALYNVDLSALPSYFFVARAEQK